VGSPYQVIVAMPSYLFNYARPSTQNIVYDLTLVTADRRLIDAKDFPVFPV